MLIRVVPSIHRPWQKDGGFYSCDFFPETPFAELSPIAELRQVRDAAGRWRRVRGVRDVIGKATVCPARAFRCRDPQGIEGYVVVGGDLGVMMFGVGDAGMGTPILWIDDPRDFPKRVAQTLRETNPSAPPPSLILQPGTALVPIESIKPVKRP